jgi:hypothetical protein
MKIETNRPDWFHSCSRVALDLIRAPRSGGQDVRGPVYITGTQYRFNRVTRSRSTRYPHGIADWSERALIEFI